MIANFCINFDKKNWMLKHNNVLFVKEKKRFFFLVRIFVLYYFCFVQHERKREEKKTRRSGMKLCPYISYSFLIALCMHWKEWKGKKGTRPEYFHRAYRNLILPLLMQLHFTLCTLYACVIQTVPCTPCVSDATQRIYTNICLCVVIVLFC